MNARRFQPGGPETLPPWLVVGLGVWIAGACSEPPPDEPPIPCDTSAECAESTQLADRLGRCVAEVYCVSDRCDGECVQPCEVVDPLFNPCEQPGRVCNEPTMADTSGVWHCTAVPITCERVEDCPVYRPADEGSWECADGICQFPGFEYAIKPL